VPRAFETCGRATRRVRGPRSRHFRHGFDIRLEGNHPSARSMRSRFFRQASARGDRAFSLRRCRKPKSLVTVCWKGLLWKGVRRSTSAHVPAPEKVLLASSGRKAVSNKADPYSWPCPWRAAPNCKIGLEVKPCLSRFNEQRNRLDNFARRSRLASCPADEARTRHILHARSAAQHKCR